MLERHGCCLMVWEWHLMLSGSFRFQDMKVKHLLTLLSYTCSIQCKYWFVGEKYECALLWYHVKEAMSPFYGAGEKIGLEDWSSSNMLLMMFIVCFCRLFHWVSYIYCVRDPLVSVFACFNSWISCDIHHYLWILISIVNFACFVSIVLFALFADSVSLLKTWFCFCYSFVLCLCMFCALSLYAFYCVLIRN